MSVLVYVENWEGNFKKSSFESVSYASQIAQNKGVDCIAVVFDTKEAVEVLGKYGANKVVHIKGGFETFENGSFAKAIENIANTNTSDIVVISGTNNGKMLAPTIAVGLEASIITNAIEVPSSVSPLTVQRKAFSNKALVEYTSETAKTVLTLAPNNVGITENTVDTSVEEMSLSAEGKMMEIVSVDKATGSIPLPEAELVVSGGRGLKGAENWHLIEELAQELGAGTACSKPVADLGWRPHHEHVGQTGLAINPELYIAAGISGAIQHLAGVSSSKNIVVINTDAEAPFFKAADYGIVGDAFEVLPKLTEAIKKFKAKA
ncbi:MAG: electron transfer flavoprotein subunit alpha/FixB family protein [Flavobacteriales bacterium]|jgi:electron transfer flavoprotein alpha subunit|nr:electron transfer flavoprotein subunit alpha/FixB family protein [Flavobacteriales bacterium]